MKFILFFRVKIAGRSSNSKDFDKLLDFHAYVTQLMKEAQAKIKYRPSFHFNSFPSFFLFVSSGFSNSMILHSFFSIKGFRGNGENDDGEQTDIRT